MGFISLNKVLGSAIKFVKPLAQTAIKAIAPQAAGLLKNITGDIFSKGKDFLTKALSASGLPSPLKSLGQKLLGKGFEALQKLAGGAIDKLLQKIVGSPAPRTTADGVTVNTPPIAARADSIAANTPAAASSSAAATAGTGSSSAPAPSGNFGTAGTGGTPSFSGTTSMPDPKSFGDLKDVNNQARFQQAMQEYQTNMNMMQMYWQTVSNVMKSMSDTLKAIGANTR